MKKKIVSNYDNFVRLDTSAYKGEWIAISGKKIISHGKDAEKVYNQAKQRTKGRISLAKVPQEQVLVM